MASPSSVHRTSPKDPIWPSWRRLDLTSRGRLEMTSRRGPNLMFKGRPWQVDLGRPQDVIRTSYRGHSKHFLAKMWDYQLDISNFFFFFLLFLWSLFYWPNLSKSNSTLKVYWEPIRTSVMEDFSRN